MIDIQVLDSNFELVGVIDTYDSFIWTERYNSCGDFELYSKFNQNILSTIKTEYYLSIPDSDRLMVVETIGLEHDYENGSIIKVQGRSIESLLDRRVIWDPLLIENVGLGSAIKTILIKSIINPDNVDRKVDGFIFSEPVPQVVEDIEIESTQLFGENLYEVISTLCQKYRVGYKLVLDENKHLVFSLYFGADRSYEQDTYPVVIFSSEFDNLLNSQYAESVVNYKNACLVLGEGDGNDKTKVEVKTPGAVYTGLNRREMCISESIGTDGETTTNENYPLQLYQKGTDALSENKVESDYNGQIDPTRIYIFEQDYNLGDLVETVNDFNLSKKARVVEYIRSYASDGINYYPTFAYDEESEEETTYNVISFNVYNARQAVEDAERAAEAALVAEDAAVDAATSALEAQGSASTAATAATNAQASADAASVSASQANASASNAAASASSASASAASANQSAINALTQLATIESVVNTLEWLTAHATLTDDTTVVADKNYYIRNQDGTFTRVADPTGNPHAQGWYELDEAITEYVASHLSLSDYGLDLVIDGNGYRIHIGTYTQGGDNGVYIINPQGEVVSFFGEEILLGNKEDNHIVVTSKSFEQKTDNGIKVLDVRTDGETVSTSIYEQVAKGYYNRFNERFIFSTKVPILASNPTITVKYASIALFPNSEVSVLTGNYNIVSDPENLISSINIIPQDNYIVIFLNEFSSYNAASFDARAQLTFSSNTGNIPIEIIYTYANDSFYLDVKNEMNPDPFNLPNCIGFLNNAGFQLEYPASFDAPSYTFGTASSKPGAFSAIIGEGLDAKNDNQVVIGRLNAECDDAFVIGCGTTALARFNSFSVEKAENGGNTKVRYNLKVREDIYAEGDVYAGCESDSTGGRKLISASLNTGNGTESSVPSGASNLTNLAEVSLDEEGIYLLLGRVRFASNTSGRRGAAWASNPTGYFYHSLVVGAPANGGATLMQTMAIIEVTSNTAPYTAYLNCYHTAGTSNPLDVDYYWRYIKLA